MQTAFTTQDRSHRGLKRAGLALVATFSLIVAACGSDDSSGNSTDGTPAANTTATTTAGDDTSSASGGYAIDASSCPDDARVPIAVGEPIKLGITLTMSGPGAAPQVAEGAQAYFAKVNAEGGIDGRMIESTVVDDGFDAARAVANITKFIQSDGIIAIAQQQGSANIMASQPVVEENCIPQFFVPAGLPEFGDPANHPWTSTAQLAYDTEALLWTQFLNETYPEGAKVGMLVFNSSFAFTYRKALETAIAGTPHEIVEVSLHEATAANVNNEMTALTAAGPDVIFGATAGAFCVQAMTAADRAGFDGQLVMSALCLGIQAFFAPAGDAADGVLMIQSFLDPADPGVADDPRVTEYLADIAKHGAPGVNGLNGFVSAGWRNAAALVEAMRIAAASDKGLTREAIANAVWNMDWEPPLAAPGVRFTMSGTDDAYPVESGTMYAYDAATGGMVDTGLSLSVEGKSGSFRG